MARLTSSVQEHLAVPDDCDTSFIVRFDRSAPEDAEQFFSFFVSTTRLLRTASNARIVIIGTSDEMGEFHLAGFLVTKHENTDAFTCAFQALKDGIELITKKEFVPDYLVSDAAPAIHNGFRNVFGIDAKIIMCYAHIIGNVERNYTFSDKDSNKIDLIDDLRCIHLSNSENTFQQGCNLFIEKWLQKEREVVRKLQKSFFMKNDNWYLGCGARVPKTSNLLERFNESFKTHQTFHIKQPLKSFIKESLIYVYQRSDDYRGSKGAFATQLEITDEQLRIGCDANVKFVDADDDGNPNENGHFIFYVPAVANEDDDLTMDLVRVWEQRIYRNFEEYAQNHYKIWKVTFPPDNWRMAHCTCQAFDDAYICNHIISIAHQLKILEKPPAMTYDDRPLFPVKKGRPAKGSKNPLSK